jgi:hypothetical protein
MGSGVGKSLGVGLGAKNISGVTLGKEVFGSDFESGLFIPQYFAEFAN